eukprot:6186662-Pleurochrysis_carterae.AAC.5
MHSGSSAGYLEAVQTRDRNESQGHRVILSPVYTGRGFYQGPRERADRAVQERRKRHVQRILITSTSAHSTFVTSSDAATTARHTLN